ncbi:hypothetical protein [Pseudomonas fluorescens]|uniref:Uncharacterized protein n=1 Tax=Pseudomonas fluorescens TaxID=294 RepID=A0A944DW91_PSEFL|nr:hypothetical protein [Pseudomonas fluorescens]MBT2297141.1 hypothetical protein [Pseudomonas fluorescens]MBT2306341.1 hypothetical protein [Pseudomonas fluorescens]MBT2310743.1 hypothetical protein [Pseudomonas fluorescens]MBT2318957.1 hypothetical protein [Pseudomonas fluorescens]MBT2328176.1 hypothetical protein [Pseudomonas fluorescens]
MLTQHILPQTQTNPSSGSVNAQVEGGTSFVTDTLNFAYDYYTTDRKLRLTLSAVQMPDDAAPERVIRGIEMVFNADVTHETLIIGEQKVYVTYWEMWAENGQTRFQTNDADTGSVSVIFNHQEETYLGTFTFGPAGNVIQGNFSIKGRDNFTL